MNSLLTNALFRGYSWPGFRSVDPFHIVHKSCSKGSGGFQAVRLPRRRREICRLSAEAEPSSRSSVTQRSAAGFRKNESESFLEYDVVIVGAGIIGLATAHHILLNTNLSVAIIDAVQPCAGATGAGQGYIWMSHRTPGSPEWALASRSKLLWEELVAELRGENVDPLEAIGWKKTGSLLVGSTNEEAEGLRKLVEDMSAAGVAAEYLTAMEAEREEPALATDYLAAAALFPEDAQIDARLTVAFFRQRNQAFSRGRYMELFQNPVRQFIRSPNAGHIQGVQTHGGDVYCKKSVVVATGAWSSTFMAEATAEWGLSIVPLVKPRKGHLLVVEAVKSFQLKHGIMEFGYPNASHSPTTPVESKTPAVSNSLVELAMTATMDHNGNLLLGSSREFVGFDIDVHQEAVDGILKRAIKFLRGLSHPSVQHALQHGRVRTGLRPFSTDGRPLIGAVHEVPGLIFATGHEGSGLCLALATAEMVVNTIQEVECTIGESFFSPVGRLVPSHVP